MELLAAEVGALPVFIKLNRTYVFRRQHLGVDFVERHLNISPVGH